MSLPTPVPTLAGRMRQYLPSALLLALGLVIGLAVAWLLHDPHTAAAERLTGTVTWSNQETRLIAFTFDGEVRDPLDGDTFYYVAGDWEDAEGTIHGSAEFPNCLAGQPDVPASMDRHRIELEAIHQHHGGQQKTHIAVFLRCLD
jgi:hypothetical protein